MNARQEVVSAGRSPMDSVIRQAQRFAACPTRGILDHLPVSVVVFNTHRQIIYANERFHDLLPEERQERDVVGYRLGEALACLGAQEDEGCGLSSLCRFCGAGQSMAALHAGRDTADGVCRLQTCDGQHLSSLDFRIHIWSLSQEGETFHAAVLTDIRSEKRLALMERIFYHDVLNLVSGMRGVCELLRHNHGALASRQSEFDLLAFTAERIAELINAQRDFSLAERGDYEVTTVKLASLPLLQDIAAMMRQDTPGRGKTLAVEPRSVNATFQSDRKLVTRVLVNMLKNALEATPRGGTVIAGCTDEGDGVRFWVRNPGQIPPEAQTQIFRRTFSTKGNGRGLGTHSMKLFAENYLEGSVGFTSTEAEGTEFFLHLPYAVGCREAS